MSKSTLKKFFVTKNIKAKVPYVPPTDEQLANFAAVVLLGPGDNSTAIDYLRDVAFKRCEVKQRWLEKHRQMQGFADKITHTRNR